MALTTNQRNTIRTAIVRWATTNRPELTTAAQRTALANGMLVYIDQHRASAIATGVTTGSHYRATIRPIAVAAGLSAAMLTALDNHCTGL